VTAPDQDHRLTSPQDARIGLGDDLESLHCDMISAACPTVILPKPC
jgi:hypothetical protein